MKEISDKIKQLKDYVQELENRCHSLFNYGNIPANNFDLVLDKLIERQKIKFAIGELEDLEDIFFNYPSLGPRF